MRRIDYIVDYEAIVGQSARVVKEKLNAVKGIKIKDCGILNLVFCEDEPIYTGNGVYFFRTAAKVIYVGSCSARNFVERVPAHFDIRSVGWFNSLLRIIAKNDGIFTDDLRRVEKKTKKGGASYEFPKDILSKASRIAFDNYSLVLINFKDEYPLHLGPATITALESFLRASDVLDPENKTISRWEYDDGATLGEIIKGKVDSNFIRIKRRKDDKAERKTNNGIFIAIK